MEMHGYCSEFCESSQNLRGLSMYMAPLFLTAKYYDILMFVWGWGALAKAKRWAKRRVLSIKRVPTDKYVLGCNSQLA